MQQSITPCQRKISDRFPVASFVVNVPPTRLFEIVCTTDPHLLQADNRRARSAGNFFTSRSSGLLRAAAGHATYLVPAEQLRRFAGKQRLYYALASYGSPRGEDPQLSILPDRAELTPSIQLSADFTGKSLDRSRIRRGPRDSKYGGSNAVLTWGGDALADRSRAKAVAAQEYDDGLSPDLWKGRDSVPAAPALTTSGATRSVDPPPSEPSGRPGASGQWASEEMGLGEAYGRPVRAPRGGATPTVNVAERAPLVQHQGQVPFGGVAGPGPEPAGFEDAPAMHRTFGGAGTGASATAGLEDVAERAPLLRRRGYAGADAGRGAENVAGRAPLLRRRGYTGADAGRGPGTENVAGRAPILRRDGQVPYGGFAGSGAEPPGFEDGNALRAAAGAPAGYAVPAYGRGAGQTAGAIAETLGFEDAPALRAALGRVGSAYGHGGPAAALAESDVPTGVQPGASSGDAVATLRNRLATAAPAGSDFTGATSDVPGRGVDDTWQDEDDEPDLASTPASGEGDPLTIRRKFEIILPATAAESGEQRYAAVLGNVEYADPSHAAYQRVQYGLHWGLPLFNQRSGALGRVLRACERRDPVQFRQAFGEADADRLLQVTGDDALEARLAPVAGALLWEAPWLDRFRTAGGVPAFQAAQNEIAIEHYFDRNLGFAQALGLTTDRALAMLFDRSIHMGLAGARAFVLGALSPLADPTERASALQALGYADLAAFQQAKGLPPSGRLGTQTHAALYGALRALRPGSFPPTAEALDRLVAAAAGRRFEQRLRALRVSTAYHDTVQRVI
jgi:hypothetical protein